MSTATMIKAKLLWNHAHIKQAHLMVRAINHPLRERIMDVVHDNDSINNTSLYVKLRIDQTVCSQHVAILRRAGIVISERHGKFIYYRLDYGRIEQIKIAINHFAGR